MRRLFPVVVLLGLLAGDAAASTGAGSLGVCDAGTLAGEVAAACAAGVPTLACCEPLVASVVLGGGGDCLCSVAHEMPVVRAGLNSSVLVALHSACGGSLAVVSACYGSKAVATVAPPSGGVHTSPAAVPASPSAALGLLPAAAATTLTTGASSSAAAVASETPIGAGCDSASLGYQIERECGAEGHNVSGDCCESVVAAVDTKGCLCAVMNDTNIVGSSPLVAGDILDLYKKCDGLRPLNGQTDCLEVMAKEGNPAPVPPSANGIAEAYMWAHRDFNMGVTGVVLEAVSIIGVVAYYVHRWITSYQKKKAAAKEEKMEINMSRMHADLRREIQADLESTMRASMLDILHGERPPQALPLTASEDDIKFDEDEGLHRKNAKSKAKDQIGTSDSKTSV